MTIELLFLHDDADFEGYWWSPEAPDDSVAGILSISTQQRPELRLFGTLGGLPDGSGTVSRWPVLRGLTKDGTFITLFDSYESESRQSWPGHSSSTVKPGLLFLGNRHLDSEREPSFSKIAANFTCLEEWFGHQSFRGSRLSGENAAGERAIHFCPSSALEFEVPGIDAVVRTDQLVSERYDAYRSAHMSVTNLISIEPLRHQPWEWFREGLRGIEELLTLFFWQPVYPRAVTVWKPHMPSDASDQLGEPNGPFQVYWYQHDSRAGTKTSYHDLLFPYAQISRDFAAILEKWFANRSRLLPVHNLLFGSFYSQMTLEFDFLAITHAVEAFHRFARPGKYHTDSQYEQIRSILENAIPPEANSDWKQKFVKGELSFGNQFSLRKRLKELVQELDQATRDAIFPASKDFIGKIVDTRNYLTHYAKDGENRALGWPALYNAFERLRMLVGILLLRELGIAEAAVVRAFRNRASTRHVLDNWKDV